jgi:Xaa-Pro aminopeptidase
MGARNLFFATLLGLLLSGVGCAPAGSDAKATDEADRPTAELRIPGAKERFQIRKALIAKRLDSVLLPAMRAHGIDLWLVFTREHNQDPLLSEIGGGWAGVRNAYLFFDRGGEKPEKIFVGSHELRDTTIPEHYDQVVYYGYSQEGIRAQLKSLVEARDPKKIGLNVSPTLPMADGLSWTLREFLEETLGPKYTARMFSAELMIRDFRTQHVAEELPVFRDLCNWTAAWEEEALSDAVVEVGKTTADDIHWWMRQKALALDLEVEFLPGVRITRRGENLPTNSPDHPVQPGDMLSIDAGLAFLDYRTDIKRSAYVLAPGETEPPASLTKAFADALRVTDRLTANMRPGAIAHQVWEKTMKELEAEGYSVGMPSTGGPPKQEIKKAEVGIYCHSVGNSTHDIGARVAVDWPFAYGDRVRYPLALNAWYSVELHVSTPIPEWDGRVAPIRIEEDAALTERGIEFFAPRQTRLLLIRGGSR